MLKLSCKFGELKWNPCWLIVLTSSTGTNYGLNEQEDFLPKVLIYNTIQDNAILKPPSKFGGLIG